jgi:hypothetical protein
MLSTLPKESDHFKRDQASEEEKALRAGQIGAISRRQERRTLVGIAALSLMLMSLIGAVLFRHILFLPWAAVFAVLLIVLRKR